MVWSQEPPDEIGGWDPGVEFRGPEGVAVGRGDRGGFVPLVAVGVDGVNGDPDEVFEALDFDHGGDRPDGGLAGLRVRGADLVADFHVLDGLRGAVLPQDAGAAFRQPASPEYVYEVIWSGLPPTRSCSRSPRRHDVLVEPVGDRVILARSVPLHRVAADRGLPAVGRSPAPHWVPA